MVPLCILGVLVTWPVRPAAAYPYLALRPVGGVAVGPTDEDLSSLHYNPAALRLLSGVHLQVDASANGYLGSYDRSTPLPAGYAGPGSPAENAPSAPIRWVAPGSLAAVSWNLGSDSVTVALGFYTPFVDETQYGGDPAHLSTRYHALNSRTYSLWGAVGIALRITSFLYVGGGFNFAWTRTQMQVYRDAGSANVQTDDSLPCGTTDPGKRPCEQWQNRQDVELDVNRWGFGFTAGVLYMPIENRLWIGLSYVSALITDGGAQVSQDGHPDFQGQAPTSCPGTFYGARISDARVTDPVTGLPKPVCGGAQLILPFPHLVYLGARGRIPDHSGKRGRPHSWEVSSWLRLTIPPDNDFSLHLERRAFPILPEVQILPLLARTAVAIDVDLREHFHGLTLAQGIIYESPRTDPQAVSPANLDGHKVDLSLSARVRVHSHLWLSAAVGATYYFFDSGAGQGFSSQWAADCRQPGAQVAYDVTSDACRRVQEGWARPTATGQYTLAVVHGTASLEVVF